MLDTASQAGPSLQKKKQKYTFGKFQALVRWDLLDTFPSEPAWALYTGFQL